MKSDCCEEVTEQLADCQLADWTSRGLADAAKRTKTKHAKSPVESASCPVRELSNNRLNRDELMQIWVVVRTLHLSDRSLYWLRSIILNQ